MTRFERLRSERGRALLAVLAERAPGVGDELRLRDELRDRFPAELVVDALGQHELRVAGAAKFGRADRMYFTRAGLEQASAEVVARHRIGRFAGVAGTAGAAVADLCCGIGGDLVALAGGGRPVLAVDRDPLHLRMALANAEAYGVAAGVTGLCADVREVELGAVAAVFADPARRVAGGGRLATGDSEPPLDWCLRLAERVPAVGIKAAPGLAHDRVPAGWELEFVAVGRELKEAALWSPALRTAARRATVLPGGDTLVARPGEPVAVAEPGEYLLDPNPSVTRAGLVQELGRLLGAWQIDPRIGFLSAGAPPRTPFGRALRVLDSGPWQVRRLAGRLRELDVGAVDFRRRGLAGDVQALRRRLRLSGSRRATLVMTRVRDRPWALICTDVDRPE